MLAMGLAAVLLPALLTGVVSSTEGKAQQLQREDAVAWARGALEAVRVIIDSGWTSFAVDGTYHLASGSGAWVMPMPTGAETVNGFTRSVVVSDVYRDATGAIGLSGTPDPSTKKVDAIVSWNSPTNYTLDLPMYVTRYFDNLSWIQTTQADFNAGVNSGTAVTNNNGGEVTLGAGGGGGNWCDPSLSVTSVDLSGQGVPTAIAAYPGTVVTGTGGNASGPTFAEINVAGNNPPVATVSGQFDNSKSNGVFTENNYGYIATTNHSQEIQILDMGSVSGSPPTFSEIGWFDAPGQGQGNSVYVLNNVGYMTDGNQFYTFGLGSGDLAGHSGSRPQLNTTFVPTLAGTGSKVTVVSANGKTYAYVAVNSATTQLQVIDVTDPTTPVIVASSNLGNGQPGTDVSVNGSTAYVVTSYASGSLNDFFSVNIATPSGTLTPEGGASTNGMSPMGVAWLTGNRAVVVGTGGTYQYQVMDVTNPASPTACTHNGVTAGLAISGGAFAVAAVLQPDGYAYSYIVTGDTHAELKMILGGNGGTYVNSGTYTSTYKNAGGSTAWNRFQANIDQPQNTSLGIQVAVAAAVGGSCANASYTFVGPNADPGQYFTVAGTGPLVLQGVVPLATNGNYTNPGQCFEYRAIFSSNAPSVAPILDDFTINYSP